MHDRHALGHGSIQNTLQPFTSTSLQFEAATGNLTPKLPVLAVKLLSESYASGALIQLETFVWFVAQMRQRYGKIYEDYK
jgi:hypothetical protein